MGGSKEGAKKARDTMLRRYGKDYFSKLGYAGGSKKGVKKGFALLEEKKRKALSRKGGLKKGKKT